MNSLNTIPSRTMSIIFVVTGIFIGALLTIQFQNSIPTSTFPTDQIQAQKALIESYLRDQNLLKTKIISLRKSIAEAQEAAESSSQNVNLETLKALKVMVGLTSVRGDGLEILLDDGLFVNRDNNETVSQSLVHASDLRDLVNTLQTAGADAIAINDQRIIASTSITSVGNTILVNNFHLLPPFTITAIGDAEIMNDRLHDQALLPDLLARAADLNIQLNVEEKPGLLVPEYTGNLSTAFIKEAQRNFL